MSRLGEEEIFKFHRCMVESTHLGRSDPLSTDKSVSYHDTVGCEAGNTIFGVGYDGKGQSDARMIYQVGKVF